MPTDNGPLSRWSRRKATARRRGAAAPVIPDAPSAVPAVAGEAVSPADDATAESASPDNVDTVPVDDVAALDLPDIESLGADSDFTVFMKEGVPAQLRNLALRKLWLSDPVLANVDGLVDYGEDFTDIKSGVYEAVKAVLGSGDDEETATEPTETGQDQPQQEHMVEESGGDQDAGDVAEDDQAVAAEEAENRPVSADDAENTKA